MSSIRNQFIRFLADESAHSPVEWIILGVVCLGAFAAILAHVSMIGFCIAWDVAG